MSLFTVEQLELIRRLRMTGITPDAVLEAFRTLEQIEADLDAARIQSAALAALIAPATKMFQFDEPPTTNPSFETTSPILLQHLRSQPPIPVTINASSSPLASSAAAAAAAVAAAAAAAAAASSSSPERCSVQTVPLASTAAAAAATTDTGTPPPAASASASAPESAPDTDSDHIAAVAAVAAAAAANNADPTAPIQIPQSCLFGQYNVDESSPTSCRPIRSQRTPMREITTLDDPSELEEFMQQGEEGCIQDMKQFITQFSLRQTTVAMMTGVSQPYISKLLNGNHRELSLRCRKNIYSWYLNCRRHPEKLSSFLADPSTRLETNGDGELIPQRRERYVFRPILIRILEGFFAQTPFPDLNRRIEIATACNQALQIDKKGVGLMPKEVVSPQVVANWFANKRKELRRRSHDECAEANAANQCSQLSSSDAASTPSPCASASNTPMDAERGIIMEERDASASVPISVPALRPDNCPIGIETSLFQSLRPSALMHSLNLQSLYALPKESCSAPPLVTTAGGGGGGSLEESSTNTSSAGGTETGSLQEGASPEQCLAEIQTQLDIVNNSVLALVNPYSNPIHTSVIKMEQTAE